MVKPPYFYPDPDHAVLVVVDIQERLAASMPEDPLKRTVKSASILIRGCRMLDVPVVVTEQYTKGLGSTVDEIREAVGTFSPIEKMAFSCYGEPAFRQALGALGDARSNVILCGIECHVCILQTALDLLENGYCVYVAADAVCSRAKLNWQAGLELMRQAGVVIGTTEIFLFQMLKEAGTERFKQISRLIR